MNSSATTLLVGNDSLFRFFISDKQRIYRHLLFVAFLALVMFTSKPQFVEPALTVIRISLLALFILLFYTNMYILVPRFFFKNRFVAYALSVVAMIAIITLVYMVAWQILGPYRRPGVMKGAINIPTLSFVVVVFIAASTAIKLFQRAVQDSIRINELEKTTMRAEMEQLKNQINPHFLFNMLNNANVLTQKDPAKASQVLMKLSDLLRYQLYDSTRASVLLTADIHFLEDFLNLEKIRRDQFECIVSKQGELTGIQVAPLLFITFVENAIKHNIDLENKSYVHLYFNVYNNVLHFKCVNSKPRLITTRKDVGGLGLANVKRRLELIYPERHMLQIDDNIDIYSVSLTIQLL
jgi:LytS/YehU family sensor histidine kinase